MSNLKTGLWSAIGAVLGGAAGATAGWAAVQYRPRARYATEVTKGDVLEDAMTIGGAAGAVAGAFIAGAIAGEPKTNELTAPTSPQLPPK
jgi:hypothetical protein